MKRKLKIKPIIIIAIIILLITFGTIYTVKTIKYHKTYEYKFLQIGYNIEEINTLEKLDNSTLDYLLTINYNNKIPKLTNEQYFLEKNIKKYINYLNENDNLKDVVAIINVNSNNKWYTNAQKTDLSKKDLILTNKFNYLEPTYNSDTMIKVSNQYSYGDNQWLTSSAYNAFVNMFNDAKKEGLTLIINSSFRSYEDQDEIYNEFKRSRGDEYADKFAARAGYSEHQTGLAVDIQTYNSTGATFEEFDEFKWLQNNAYKYGFILRYPKDKTYLTGYEYESWHYRYVGIEAATYIHKNNITFDEYYAYFLD